MSVLIQGDQVRAITQGVHVAKATAALPQGADGTLFTITGGRVLVVSLIGEVTTVIETTANASLIKFNPTATGADTDLCAALDITADAVGTLYSLTGTPADAMTSTLLCVPSSVGIAGNGIVLSEGVIELECAGSATGSVKWDIIYVPLDTGASVA